MADSAVLCGSAAYCAPKEVNFLNYRYYSTMSPTATQLLLIEEEQTLLEITAFRLELLGYQVIKRQTADEAMRWMSEQLPDLLVVGHVAEMEPIEFLNHLSNDQRTSELPVIYLSSNTDMEEVQRAFNAGADEFLVTPYDPLVLEKKVEGLIAAAKTNSES
jgi:DNA-binding response OmpR family regulator